MNCNIFVIYDVFNFFLLHKSSSNATKGCGDRQNDTMTGLNILASELFKVNRIIHFFYKLKSIYDLREHYFFIHQNIYVKLKLH